MGKHLTIKLLLFLSLFILCYTTGFAQGGDVTGRVTDASDGQTLPGVTILIKSTTMGTVTDIDGYYKIRVNPNTTLVFSFIGYETQEILVQPNSVVNVALKFKSTFLSETVVIGYGIQKKDDATGSVSAVQLKDFNKGSIASPSQLLIGKIPGVQITSTGGAPGGGTTIRIRGGSSISASNDPLIVIDGVPMDNESISGSRNTLSFINPSDIESVTVLKDASATAIFGSRGSNGVIMITTKKGAVGKGGKDSKSINLSYNGTFSVYTIPKKIDVLKADEYRTIINNRYASNENVLALLGKASTDWQNEIYQTALGMDHYLSATGAYKILPYMVSLGYSDENGILKTDNMKRTTLSATLNPSLFDDHLKINFNVKGMFIKNKFADQGAIGAAVQYDPTKPVKSDSVYTVHYTDVNNNPDSLTTDYGGYYAWTQPNGAPVSQGSSNPVALLNLRDDKSDVKRIIGNIQLDYKLHFLPDLRANLNMGYDYSKSDGTVYVPDYAPWVFNAVYGGGLSTVYKQEKKNELLDFYLNYVKNVSDLKSTFDIMAGYSWQHFWRKGSNYSTNIIKTVVNDSSDYATESYLVSFFGRVNYSLMSRYLITFTLRDDGTSRFSPDTRWGLFPAVAIGWKINEEPWMKNVTVLSQLKLRAGYGITGQQDIGQGDYPYLARYTYSEQNAMYQFGNQFLVTLRPNGFDKKIKWEETTTWNLGLDYGFSNDRFYGSLDFYFKQTKDLINFIPIPAGANLTNYLLTNVGDMENRGVEFSINTKPVSRENFFWEVNLNATYNANKITKLTVTDDPNYIGVLTGGISGGVGNTCQVNSVGYAANSYFVFEQVYDAHGNPIEGMYVDRNGDGQITDNDRYRFKDPAPDYYFGISSNLQYKSWSFSFSGRANIGNYIYNNVISENAVWERLYRPEGPYIGNVTSDVKMINFVSPRYLSNYFIQDGSFFRMDNITLSYLFNKLINGKVKLLLSATVNNAFVITRYSGIDPEISNGIDNRIYPRPRVFVFGVNLMF
ncbi:MAG: SusC/RagA family TonB-linked outer membrane protein [Bacteroidetes bacterium]|nr:SusC/RagA family TonB-linked outer membrane protein [Bacteroidota bacterium]